MELHQNLAILGLSRKERLVLLAIIEGTRTPLLIARRTKVTRPAVYDILRKLKLRGVVHSYVHNGKKYWSRARNEDIDSALYEAKRTLLSISEGANEIKGLSDGTVIMHTGKEAIGDLIAHIAKDHKNERLFTLQGSKVSGGWESMVGQEKINEFNANVKKNGILTETIIPRGWFEDTLKETSEKEGLKWIQGFADRALATYQIDREFFNHAGQIFMFKSSLYLLSMKEGLIIEIRNSELQKMIKQMFSFIEEHAEKIDVNSMTQKKLYNSIKN